MSDRERYLRLTDHATAWLHGADLRDFGPHELTEEDLRWWLSMTLTIRAREIVADAVTCAAVLLVVLLTLFALVRDVRCGGSMLPYEVGRALTDASRHARCTGAHRCGG